MSTLGTTGARPVRDPFIDLLRTGAIVVVVFGHWLMPVLARHGDTLSAGNSLATPGWWTLTWLAQVMPVFFFAGGAANYHSYLAAMSHGDWRDWLAARIRRLIVPVLPLLAVGLLAPAALHSMGLPDQPVRLATGIVGQLLWFLAVYLLTVACTPPLLAATRRWGLAGPVVLGCAAAGVDLLRFHGLPLAGFLNELLVWLAIEQLGMCYAAGRFAAVSRRAAAGWGVAGFAGTALLVICGPYPASMVGLPGQAVSNMAPATLCLLTLGCGQIGLLFAVRDRLLRAAARPAVASLLRTVGPRCLTTYLWHMPALVLVAGVAVFGFGYATPAPGSGAWLVVTPLWLGTLAVVLFGLLRIFGRVELMRGRPVEIRSSARPVIATLLGFVGLLGIAARGFAPPAEGGTLATLFGGPLPWSAAIVAGLVLVTPGIGRRGLDWLVDRLAGLVSAIFDGVRR